MKNLLLTFLLIYSFTASSQTTEEIIGNWQFYTIRTQPGTTLSQYNGATSIMGSMTMQLNADKSYIMSLMGMNEKGQWELKGKEIVFHTSDGKSYSFPIVAYETNLMTLDKQKLAIVVSREGANVPPPPAFKEEKSYTKVTAAQVSKKWYLKQFPSPANMTEKQKEAFGEKMSGSYVEFKTNGKYSLQVGDKKENGTWSLNPKNDGIITGSKNMPKEAFVKSITATELVVIDSETDEEWIYSTIE
ncbi:hypothetical protein ACX0HA_06285 [Flavobacterium hauense]